jgi:hypothetical protein
MPKYMMEIQTIFTKWVEIEADSYDEARDNAWDWFDEGDALHNADLDTEISHVYGREHYKEDKNV